MAGTSKLLVTVEKQPVLRPWNEVFVASRIGMDVVHLRGTAGLNESWGHLLEGRLATVVKRLKLRETHEGGGMSPASGCWGCEEYHHGLGGCLEVSFGNYIGRRRGVWVHGRDLFRLLCYELHLSQPRRSTAEVSLGTIPTHRMLLARLKQEQAAPAIG